MTVGEIISQVRSQGGIDASTDVVRGWVLDRHDRLITRSRYRMAMKSLGNTAVDDAEYVLSEQIVDLFKVRIEGVGKFVLASIEELWDLQNGASYELGRGEAGFFAPRYGDDGGQDAEGFELFPAPDEAGLEMTGLVALRPTVPNDSEEPRCPREFHFYIRAGAIADGLALMDERINEAGAFEELFEAGIVELSKRRKSRIGSGPQRIPIRF